MPHAVERHFDDQADLIGLDRSLMTGDRLHLEVAKLLLERKLLSLTGLATALRLRSRQKAGLDRIIIAHGNVAPADYYQAVADVYGLPFVDLAIDPPAFGLDTVDLPPAMIAWRRGNAKLLIATSAISRGDIEWADGRFGENGYDFVIAAPAETRTPPKAHRAKGH